MTATISATEPSPPAPGQDEHRRPNLVKAELRKIITTSSWWILGIFLLGVTGLALLINVVQANYLLDQAEAMKANPPDFSQMPTEYRPTASEQQQILEDFARSTDVPRVLAEQAANVFTSGQFFGLMLVAILGAIVVTNEYYHQTATATFLTTPRRTSVVMAKLGAAVLLAAGFWFVASAISVLVGGLNFSAKGFGFPLTDPVITRAVLMNLLAYVLWAILGVGFGVLIRSQLGATITTAGLYLISVPAALLVFGLIRAYLIQNDAVFNFIVLVPGVASMVMVSAEPIQFGPGANGPAWWVGALVLVGYSALAGVIGTLIMRKRDIS